VRLGTQYIAFGQRGRTAGVSNSPKKLIADLNSPSSSHLRFPSPSPELVHEMPFHLVHVCSSCGPPSDSLLRFFPSLIVGDHCLGVPMRCWRSVAPLTLPEAFSPGQASDASCGSRRDETEASGLPFHSPILMLTSLYSTVVAAINLALAVSRWFCLRGYIPAFYSFRFGASSPPSAALCRPWLLLHGFPQASNDRLVGL